MSKTRKATLLDIDPSIIEKNLLLESSLESEKEIERLFPNLEEGLEPPSTLVRPTPGFCIKTRKSNGTKVFINVCQTDCIPAPEDISEERLAEILGSDEACDFRVPMSIGNPRQEPDKSGKPSDVYDVAINDQFFKRVGGSELFKSFLFQVVFEAVQQKYEIEITSDEFVVLKNRRAMGTLQQHRIQQRGPQNVQTPRTLIQEMSSSSQPSALMTETSVTTAPVPASSTRSREPPATVTAIRQPLYRLIQRPSVGPPTTLVGEFQLPDIPSAKDLALDVGADRITLEARRHNYLLDIFVPFGLDSDNTCAQFDVDVGLLTVTMPIVSVS